MSKKDITMRAIQDVFLIVLFVLWYNTAWGIGTYKILDAGNFQVKVNPDDKTAIIEGLYDNSISDILIPSYILVEEYDGMGNIIHKNVRYTVTTIGKGAFLKKNNLLSVHIPNSVTTIDYYAFGYCTSLKFVNIPNSVITILGGAFEGCSNLTSVNIPNSVRIIGDGVFEGCPNLTSVNIPESVMSIGSRAFYGCSNLESVNGVPTVGEQAFFGCSKLQSVSFSDNATEIGNNAFNGCSNLSSVNISNSAPTIGIGAFNGCSNLESVNGVVASIGAHAFQSCSKLKSISISDNATSIGEGAFRNCPNLESVNISNSITSIGKYAFNGCSNLESVNGVVASIGAYAFWNCSKLKSISISDNATSIEHSAFSCCSNLESVNISNSITSIGEYAFNGCSNLESVKGVVASIGAHAFSSCSKLKSISISDNVTSIGNYAFSDCLSLKSVNIPNSVKTIKHSAFEGCSTLTDLTIGNSVTAIGVRAFFNCSGLKSVNIPKSVTTIGESAFRNCSTLTDLTIGNSVTAIGVRAFLNCSGLKSVNIPKSVTTIGEYAFCNCSNMTDLAIGNSITVIGSWTFGGCSSLSSVNIPNSITRIGNSAFSDCSNMTDITIGNSVTAIGESAFIGKNIKTIYCNALTPPAIELGFWKTFSNYDATLIVPKESESLYRAAEGWKNFFIANGLKAEAYSDFYGTLAPEKRYEAKGVTADGESKLIMYIDDDKDFSGVPAPEIHVKLNGGEVCADEKVTGTIGNWQKLDNGKWGFIYTAPQDYIGTDNSFLLDIELVGENSSLTACGQIKVYRPGVLFLHGLNSSKECFKYIHSELLKNDYTMAQLLNGDYEGTNRSTFYDNTYVHKIVQKHLEQLYNQLTGVGIVSSKYDLVGHSMGGILSRLYSQEVNKDAVNRIITINTPHYGSNMPNVVERLRCVFINILKNASIIYRPAILSASQLILYKTHDFLNGAGNDLMSNSMAIQNLNDKHVNVPVHALCSIMNGDDDVDKRIFLYCENNIETGLTELYLNVFNTRVNSFHDILNVELGSNQHDGVVTLESQCCGLTNNHVTIEEAPYRGVLGEKSDAHHINTCRWNETVNNLHSLLQSPKSSDKFCATGFPMTDLSVQQSQARANEKDDNIEFVEPVDSSYIKINVEVRNDSIKTAYVTVDKSGDMAAYSIFSFIDDNRMLIGSNKDTLRFALPEDYAGNLTFYAMGRTSYNALVCDSANVELTNDLTMNYLLYENRDTLYLTVGQSVSPAVIVGWNNGQEQYYSPEFTTDNTSILQIDNDIVTAIQTGVCMLKASAGEASDSVYVRVMENPSVVTGIHDIMNEEMKVFNRQHQLVLRFGNDYTGNLDVKFYSIDGRSVKEVNRNIEMRSGEQFYIDLTDLAKQLYVVRIKFKNEVMGYKMLLK